MEFLSLPEECTAAKPPVEKKDASRSASKAPKPALKPNKSPSLKSTD